MENKRQDEQLLQTPWYIRRLTVADVPGINAIDMSYESTNIYQLRRRETDGVLHYTLSLAVPPQPFQRIYTDWDWTQCDQFSVHLQAGSVFGAFLVAGRCVGLVELTYLEENAATRLVALYVHRPVRGLGVGRALLAETVAWARTQESRAILLETQVSNIAAIRFYQAAGFHICGLHEMLNTNDDAAYNETTVFMALTL